VIAEEGLPVIELACRQAGSTTVATPDYQRIIDDVEHQLETGALQPGQALPSISRLAVQYGTSQTTVKTALAILRARGLVRGQQGKATYVAER
jgi:GntR family transcriptional regulator